MRFIHQLTYNLWRLIVQDYEVLSCSNIAITFITFYISNVQQTVQMINYSIAIWGQEKNIILL